MSKIDDGGPAFPIEREQEDKEGPFWSNGMSLRAYFAGQAITAIGGWCPDHDDGSTVDWTDLGEVARLRAEFAVMQADALIAELAEGGAA